ncbi:MAG TPA: hypothetical protein VFK30_05680, partial [Anaerolineae bacterium]|nr:hypothetical protein [Anaerolineae bacterium]
VLIFLALSIMSLGDVALASETFQTSVDLLKAIGDQWGQAYALSNYAEILLMVGEMGAARMSCEDGWHLWQRVGDTWGEGNHLCTLGSVEWYDGNDALSRTHLEQSVELLRRHSDRWGLARALNRFGFTLMDLKEVARAQDCFAESLDLWRSMGNQRGIVHCLIGFGGVAAHSGHPARSAQLLGAVENLSREALYIAFGIDRARYERTLEAARLHVAETIWQHAFESGQRMTIDEAITLALEHEPHD